MMGNLSASGLEGFEAFGKPRATTAVYLLLGKGVVLYVGKSLNIYTRIGQHVQCMRRHEKGLMPYKGKDREIPAIVFDEVKVKWVPLHLLDGEELKLIQRYLPEYNVIEKRTNIDVSNIPSVAKLIASAPRTKNPMHTPVRRRAA